MNKSLQPAAVAACKPVQKYIDPPVYRVDLIMNPLESVI